MMATFRGVKQILFLDIFHEKHSVSVENWGWARVIFVFEVMELAKIK
jgi:hypothetical protein